MQASKSNELIHISEHPSQGHPSSRIVWDSQWNGRIEIVFQTVGGFIAATGDCNCFSTLFDSQHAAVDALFAQRSA